ncbi:MAG: peptidylprolyl isomerase [Eubacterium sp.]|nr:peptidylprolyl isomerase [Eubacterium sp.]
MAKDIEKETEELIDKKEQKAEKKAEKAAAKEKKAEEKLNQKKEKAEAKKSEIVSQVRELKAQIAEETDEKKKKKLRRQRDDLIAQRDAIIKSKDGMTIPLAPLAQKRIKACIAIIVVIALLFVYLQTGMVRHGLMGSLGIPQSTFVGVVVKDGDGNKHNIKVSTYNYYFAMLYNQLQQTQEQYSQYGMEVPEDQKIDFDKKLSAQKTKDPDDEKKEITWAQYMHDQVLDNIKSTYTYYYEAVKANKGKEPSITKDQQKELDEALDNYKSTAQGYDFTVSGYLTAAMGKGVTEEVFRKEAKISYISENYQEDYQKELKAKQYDKKEYEKYRDENKDDLVSVDIKYFECDSEDDAKAFKKALNADGSNFAELASKYSSSDFDKKANKNEVETTYKDLTKPTLQGMNGAIAQADEHEHSEDEEEEHKYSGLDWVFSSKRRAGDVKQLSTSVVYIITPARLSDTKTVTVRHILIKPFKNEKGEDGKTTETDSENASEASDKEWKNAKKKADKVLAEYNKSKKTAAAFGKLAEEYSKDSNASDGGIYENITPNQMVPTFNAWCFDSSRKAGDVSIVKTEYGYHIIYFEKTNDLTVWEYTAQQSLASEDTSKAIEKLEKGYSIKQTWLGSRYFETDTDIDS